MKRSTSLTVALCVPQTVDKAGLHLVYVLVRVQEVTQRWVRAVCTEAGGKQAVNESVLLATAQYTTSWVFQTPDGLFKFRRRGFIQSHRKQKATRKMQTGCLLFLCLIETFKTKKRPTGQFLFLFFRNNKIILHDTLQHQYLPYFVTFTCAHRCHICEITCGSIMNTVSL